MMSLRLRQFPLTCDDGPTQMARDEVLLESAVSGQAGIRFYRWREPTVSLGYFQPSAARLSWPALAALSWVRRPTGGAAILHHHELTYAFALPPRLAFRQNSWVCLFHGLIRELLEQASLAGRSHLVRCGEERKLGEVLCFLHQTVGDLLLQGTKVVGSAQRKHRGALLQHGSILLRHSPYVPQLPGILDLAGEELFTPSTLAETLANRFAELLHAELVPDTWTEQEQQRIEQLTAGKYRQASWNEKR